ncbi:unnamed protein product [Macrosiphum euphorbiae]|uniref:Uncharacterized protein n=1 Tax=Macrosiphum euphorbiae TaxID=13131 RepID=A0AAV0WHM6_9HEMI|nr:unnamed protein product [Macrosiphum euphorbiae]
MDTLDTFIDNLSDEEKENFERYSQFYTSFGKNQMQPQGNHQERNDNDENNIEEDSMGILKSLNVDDLYESTDEIQSIKKKMKRSIDSPYKEVGAYKSTSNNNSKSNNCDEKNPKSIQNLSKIVKDKRIVCHFNNYSSSDEISEDDENELEKEVTELGRIPSRQQCVNINEISTKSNFLIKDFKKCRSTVFSVDTSHMPQGLDLWNDIEKTKQKCNVVCEYKRSKFYRSLEKSPIEFFYLEEYKKIIPDKNCVNLYDALNSFQVQQNYTIKFVKSKLGDNLKLYSANSDVCWDVVHLESNTNQDLLKYKLSYGQIPKNYISEVETIVCRILFCKLASKGKKSTDNPNQFQNEDYDLLEGELELLIFNYWQLSTSDMLGYKEHLNRKKKKMVFYYMFKNLETNIIHNDFGRNERRKHKFMNILKLYKSYAAFENPSILTAAGLAYVKNSASKLVPFLGEQYDLWSGFFHTFNMHSTVFEHTVKALLEGRDNIFRYLFSRVLEIDNFNIAGTSKSLWFHGVTQKTTPELEDTIIKKKDVANCLSFYFCRAENVPRALCVKFDNYYFLYIDLFVSFLINTNLYKYQTKLTADNCKHFFLLNDRNFHEIYLQNLIPSFETKTMVTSMITMLNNHLNARLDGQFTKKLKMDIDVTYMFFKLIYLHLNYALAPAMLREGPALTDVQWASIFISDLDKMEMFYLKALAWRDKPCMLGGAADDLDYNPETEDLEPLQNVCHADVTCSDVTDDEESYFHSSDSETEGLDEIIDKILIEKKKERLLAECEYLKENREQEIFNRKLSKIIQDRIQKVGYFNKLAKNAPKKTATERKNVGHVEVEKPMVNKVKSVMTLKDEREMVAAGVLDVYLLKNNETYVNSPDALKVFGLLSKDKIKASKSPKQCVLCPNSKVASFNMLVSANVAVACCLTCIELVANIIKQKIYSYEQLQEVLVWRIELRFKAPLLFNKNLNILTRMPRMFSHNDMYCCTYNKLLPNYGKILKRIDVFSHHSEHVNRSYL